MATDRTELEGARERAQERGKPHAFGHFDEKADPERPYLGDPSVVDALVRGLVLFVVELRQQFNEGNVAGDRVVPLIEHEARKLASVFYGRSGTHRVIPGWNLPGALGAALVDALGLEDTDPDRAAFALFMGVARQALDITVNHENAVIDDEAADFQASVVVATACAMLLGMPPERGDPD